MYCISYTTKLNTPSHLTAVDPANRSGIVGFEALHRRSPEMHHAHFPINTPMKENPSSLLTPPPPHTHTHTPNHCLPLDQFIQIRVYIFIFFGIFNAVKANHWHGTRMLREVTLSDPILKSS
jgi:hypothetical protein